MEGNEILELIETLHPLEIKIVPLLIESPTFKELVGKTDLSEIEVMRAVQWLGNKQVLKLETTSIKKIELAENGPEYVERGLPEKRFLQCLVPAVDGLTLDEITQKTGLKREEINVCIGTLRKKVAIDVVDKKFKITDQGHKILTKESLEEQFLRKVNQQELIEEKLEPEEKFAYDNLIKRKQIIQLIEIKTKTIQLTDLGNSLTQKIKESPNILSNLGSGQRIERVTHKMLKDGSWKGKTFRKYDVKINVPTIYRGKRHFVNQAVDYARRVWVELGFKEMKGPILNTSFWNFDALFTPQDHPVREMQDTFFIKNPEFGKLPSPELVAKIKAMHEHGGDMDSTGWQYNWNSNDSKKNVLRTHTTVLSAKTLAALKKTDFPAKFFAVGKCFRNETLDWSHLFEFNQFEGIIVDPDANFKHLLGYLKLFMKKIGFPQARFRPAYFPYTEMSTEIDIFHPVHKQWYELGGAGILRPEVVEPLLGEAIPVLAWGPGLDRQMVDFYKLNDLRHMYKNDVKKLRDMKEWMK
ncbi:phenylalanine--tRNA ligase subunit alpha [Candidatus Woesearchaeota archaeon]|jgi:phenylalanyl-tRNA synthetase alpha chain|nr:phenylalanine--tRNA ligase subunit alpha [Candidatus Woesearchaeota archaeon]